MKIFFGSVLMFPYTLAVTQSPLSLSCIPEILSESEQIRVSCTATRDLATLTFECTHNDQPITEGCESFRGVK